MNQLFNRTQCVYTTKTKKNPQRVQMCSDSKRTTRMFSNRIKEYAKAQYAEVAATPTTSVFVRQLKLEYWNYTGHKNEITYKPR